MKATKNIAKVLGVLGFFALCVFVARQTASVGKLFPSANATSSTGTLLLSKVGTGEGTVSSSPIGINCGPSCSSQTASFTAGSLIKLYETPDASSTFVRWYGCSPVTSTICSLLITPNTTTPVMAQFRLN